MTIEEYRIQWFRNERWRLKLWNMVKDIPKFRSERTHYQNRVLVIWQRFYLEWLKFTLSKDKNGCYLHQLAFPK